jgi:sugar phosphate isomerase/epimerase
MDEGTLERTLHHCKIAIDLTAELGAPFYSVHAGAATELKPEDLGSGPRRIVLNDLEKAYERFVHSVRELARYAEHRGVKLLVENHVVPAFSLVDGKNLLLFASTAEDISVFLSDVQSTNLGLLVDVGHLNVTAHSLRLDPVDFLAKVGPHIVAFHLSENDGLVDQNLPFGRDAWFMSDIRDFPKATFIIEVFGLDVDEIRACTDVVTEALAMAR